MGRLAEEIKQASQVEQPVTGEMLKAAGIEELLSKLGIGPLKDYWDAIDVNTVPGTDAATESLQNALKWGAGLSIPAAAIIAALKYRGHSEADERRKKLIDEYTEAGESGEALSLPPTEYDVPVKASSLKKEAGILGWPLALAVALLGPSAYHWASRGLGGAGFGNISDLTKITENPLTHPLGASAIVGMPIATAGLTHHFLDKHLKKVRTERVEREKDEAEKEFQQALEAEYTGAKAANLAEHVDMLAGTLANNDAAQRIMKKKANGDPHAEAAASRANPLTGSVSGLAGLYVLGMLMLTGAAGVGGYQWAKKGDKGRQRSKALERLVKRRALATPPTFTAVTKKPGEEETIAEEPI